MGGSALWHTSGDKCDRISSEVKPQIVKQKKIRANRHIVSANKGDSERNREGTCGPRRTQIGLVRPGSGST